MAVSIFEFFDKIVNELHESLYLALGGSLDDQSFDWAERGLYFAGIGLKIVILLTFIGCWYWLLVYTIKHAKKFLPLSPNHIRIARSSLRYFWLLASLIAIMTQVGIKGDTIKAVAKASAWSGFFYVLLSMSGSLVHWLFRHYEFNESIEQLVKNLTLVVLLVVASGTILAQFGFDIVSLVAGLGIVGLAVGFAAQSTLANFIAGVTILIEQSFQVGDWIQIGEQEGRVVKITLRTTHILDRDNIVVILPNSTVASSEVINLTSKTFIRFSVPVRIALNADVATARSLILSVLKSNEQVLPHPLSTVTIDRVDESAMVLIVRFWVSPQTVARLPILKEKLIETIKQSLDSAGLVPPYPHMQLIIDDKKQVVQELVLPKQG